MNMSRREHLGKCLNAVGRIRVRLIALVVVEALAVAAAVWLLAFSLEVGLHSLLILPAVVRTVIRPAIVAGALAAGIGWAVSRLRGHLSAGYLASVIEDQDSRFKGRLAAVAEADGRDDPVSALLAREAAGILEQARPAVSFGASTGLVKFVVVTSLLSPLFLLAGGPGRLLASLADCLFPQREATIELVFQPGALIPEDSLLPAGRDIEFRVSYDGWPPVEAELLISSSDGASELPLQKVSPGILRANSRFPPGEALVQPVFFHQVFGGNRRSSGKPKTYRFVEPARLANAETVVISSVSGAEWKAAGLEVLAPPGREARLTLRANSRLKSVELSDGNVPLETKGETASIELGGVRELEIRFRLVPEEGIPSSWYSYRLAVERDAPPRVAAFIKDGSLHTACADDWGLSRMNVNIQTPLGADKSLAFELHGRSKLTKCDLAETFPGPPGRYLIIVEVRDQAVPKPNSTRSPVLVYERKPETSEDPLLTDIPRKTERFLARKPPRSGGLQTPPAAHSPEGGGSPEHRPGPQSLEPPPSLPKPSSDSPAPPDELKGKTSRYSGMPSDNIPETPESEGSSAEPPPEAPPQKQENSDESGGTDGGTGSGTLKEETGGKGKEGQGSGKPPSLPEGGVAGKGDKHPAQRPGQRPAPPDEGAPAGAPAAPGSGPKVPVDGGMPSGEETGPTPEYAEKVEETRVKSLEVSEEEIKGITVRHPFAERNPSAGPEVEREPGDVLLEEDEQPVDAFDARVLPARYRAVLEFLGEAAGK